MVYIPELNIPVINKAVVYIPVLNIPVMNIPVVYIPVLHEALCYENQ